jgi:DNA-binding MarR family transcriptional regulator
MRDLHPDMTVMQVLTLALIAESPGILQRDLYRQLGATDSAASRIVAILSDVGSRNTPGMGLVSMRVNPQDRRERLVELTSKGRRLWDDVSRDLI